MSRKETLNALFRIAPAADPAAPAPNPGAAPETKGADVPSPAPSARAAEPGPLGAPNDPERGPPTAPAPFPTASEPRMRAGAVGALAGSLRGLTDEADALRARIAAAEQVVTLDPALIDPAPVADRLRGAGDGAIEDLKASIREAGQQVPVLVRPHPSKPGRWQAAYGHRRIRAARELGLGVAALVRNLDDAALAIAQGQENIARRDLSFIEKAFFAQGLERSGLPRAAIVQALATDKGDLSRYIAVAAAVPAALAQGIGPAPKAGRARWQALAGALAAAGWRGGSDRMPPAIEALMEKQAFAAADSDGRFALALAALTAKPPERLPHVAAADVVLANEAGATVARLTGQGPQAALTVHDRAAPGFAAFLSRELPELYRRWRAARDGQGAGPA